MSISIDGLITGFNTTKLIQELLQIQRRPITFVEAQIEDATAKKTAYLEISARLLALQQTANRLGSSALFSGVSVRSSNESAVLASGTEDLKPGSYTFRVAQMARTSQHTSAGFATADRTAVGAGTLTLEIGGGSLAQRTSLESLNGGAGVARGSIRITDRTGNTAIVDISAAVTIDDVIDAINNTRGVAVAARLAGQGDARPGQALVIEDTSGGAGTLSVSDIGAGRTARDLGIRAAADDGVLQGAHIAGITERSRLAALNGGNGVSQQAGGDIAFTLKDGSSFTLDISAAATVGDVLDLINAHAGITARIATDGNRIIIEDTSAAVGATTISEVLGGQAARDLGIAGSFTAASLSGERLAAGLNAPLLRELRGGSGIAPGAIQITDRAGSTAVVDVSGAETVNDIIDAINAAAGIAVEASLNSAGDGFLLRDTSGQGGQMSVAEVGAGSTAADLGLLGAADASSDTLEGTDVKLRYITLNTRLATLNGGRGVHAGSIRITDMEGRAFTVNLAQEETIGQVLRDINGAASAAGSDVIAAINADGNGIILTAAAGGGILRVDEVGGGTTARDLGIAGTAAEDAPGVIDGAFERRIDITETMTLTDVKNAIDALGMDLHVALINDGSTDAPFRLFVSGARGGAANAITLHVAGSDLSFLKTSDAQDAIVLSGGGDGAGALLVRSPSNTFNHIIPGLTLTAVGQSAAPVEIAVAADDGKSADTLAKFVEDFNSLVDTIADLTRFDPDTETAGLLLGDGTLRAVLRQMSFAVTRAVVGNPSDMNLAAHIGLRTGPGGKLTFHRSQFMDALAGRREAVIQLFAAERTIDRATQLADFRNGEGVRTTAGRDDFEIHTRDGASFTVNISSAKTAQDVVNAINEAAGNASVTAQIAGDGRGFVLRDGSEGSAAFRVAPANASPAFNDLGINRSADQPGGAVITGAPIDLNGDWGMGRRLVEAIEAMVNTRTGSVELRTATLDTRIESLHTRKTSLEKRLTAQEERLKRQFAQLEVIMGQQQATLERLNAVMSSLQNLRKK